MPLLGALEYISEDASLFAKYEILQNTDLGLKVSDTVLDVVRALMEVPVNGGGVVATPDYNTMKEAFRKVVATSALLSMLGEDTAELVTEMLSEALSNAVYSGFAGALDMMFRLRTGAIPPQGPTGFDYVDPEWTAFLDAASGMHFHALALARLEKIIRGTADALERDPIARGLIQSFQVAFDPKTAMLSMFAEMFRTAVMRLMESVIAVAEAIFARVEDAAEEWRAAYIMYKSGEISQTEYQEIEARINAELDAAEAELAALEEDLKTALSNFNEAPPTTLDTAITMLNNAILGAVANDVNINAWAYIAELSSLRVNAKPSGVKYRVTVGGTTAGEVAP